MIRISKHAKDKWNSICKLNGFKGGTKFLKKTLSKAKPEETRYRLARWNLFLRGLKHGDTEFLTSNGWRFVIKDSVLVTVERVKAHENMCFN